MIDFEKRLKSLKDRRQGTREVALFESYTSDLANTSFDIRKSEAFEILSEAAGVKYTIGAMAPVDAKSTEVSIKEGNRVADSLIDSLANAGESVIKRMQGSVALDIHIKGHSDVDMLIIVQNKVNIETPVVDPSKYVEATDTRSLLDIAKDVRHKSEIILPVKFPKVIVDCSGNKSIALSGGSLARKVDIVPAIWYDSTKYQQTSKEHDRGIKIYHKADHKLHLNHPFLHIKHINDKDFIYTGNLKCVIRLMKSMIADMPDYKKNVAKKLTSFDLAGIAYHMDENLSVSKYFRLGLVEKIRNHLYILSALDDYRSRLRVPDGSRLIFDSNDKVDALTILTDEFTDLAESIYRELNPYGTKYDPSVLLNKLVV